MTERKLYCSANVILEFQNFIAQSSNEEVAGWRVEDVDVTNEFIDILYSLAECQPHQFSDLKLRAQKLLHNLEEGEN